MTPRRMRNTVRLLFIAAVVATLPSAGAAARPSGQCETGQVNPFTTPAGLGAAVEGDPASGPGVARICNIGLLVPARGAVTVAVDPNTPAVGLVADGDPSWVGVSCTAGYLGVRVDASGPSTYGSATDDFSPDSNAKSPEAIAGEAAERCPPSVPV